MRENKSKVAIEFKQLSVNYGKTPALWDISLKVPAGVLGCILGPNGAGKSTLLKAALGLVKPISGCVSYFGQPLKKERSKVAYIPQREIVDWDFPMTLFDLVLMGRYGRLGLFRYPSKEDKEATWHYLTQLGLQELARRQIGQLSGGQQQRAFLARALAQEADLFLMDEPYSGVDAASKEVIFEVISALKKAGKTLLVVHHDLHSVVDLFDWAVLLNMHLVAAGSVKEVLAPELLQKTFGRDCMLFEEVLRRNEEKKRGAI